MEPDLIEKKIKAAYILSRISQLILIGQLVILVMMFFFFITIREPLAAAFADSFVSLIIYLIGYSLLLNIDGEKRKNAVGVYYLVLFIYMVFGIVGEIFMVTDSNYIEMFRVVSKLFFAFLSIMLFLNTRSKVSRQPAAMNGMLISFILNIAFEALYCFFKYPGNPFFNIISIVLLLPLLLLAFIASRSFDDVFYSHFIEENPKYFITPSKPKNIGKAKVITLIVGVAVIIILIALLPK